MEQEFLIRNSAEDEKDGLFESQEAYEDLEEDEEETEEDLVLEDDLEE